MAENTSALRGLCAFPVISEPEAKPPSVKSPEALTDACFYSEALHFTGFKGVFIPMSGQHHLLSGVPPPDALCSCFINPFKKSILARKELIFQEVS